MTLQDAKNKVAQRYHSLPGRPYKNWDDMENALCLTSSGTRNLFARIDEAVELYAHNNTCDLLDRYTEFLQKEGYIDTDATLEHPTAIDMFLKKDKLK